MGFWNNILRKDERKCFQVAKLLVRGQNGILKQEFKFTTVSEESISDTESALAMTYNKKTRTIFTNCYWLDFCNGARVEFADGSTMTISNITKIVNEEKAQRDGKGIIGLNISLGA